MKKIRICSLFSGIGGFETGVFDAFGKENCEVVFASEIDKHASRAYGAVYGHEPNGDIRAVDAADIPDHDLLVGGFPCQAFSIAGRRLGFSDTRGTLFFEIARIAKEKQPKLMILENVKGLLSHDGGKTLETIVLALGELGYATDFQLLNSKNHGSPQNRERIFIVASRDAKPESWGTGERTDAVSRAKRAIGSIEGARPFNFDFPKAEKASRRLFDVLEPEDAVDKRLYLDAEREVKFLKKIRASDAEDKLSGLRQIGYVDKNCQGNRIYSSQGVSATIASQTGGLGGSGGGMYAVPSSQEVGLKFVGGISEKPNWLDDGKELSRNYKQGSRVYDASGIAATLSSQGVGGLGGYSGLYLTGNLRVRKLSPLECLRLQGFPDTYYASMKKAKISVSQMYKMAGNAVTTNVIAAIAKQAAPLLK